MKDAGRNKGRPGLEKGRRAIYSFLTRIRYTVMHCNLANSRGERSTLSREHLLYRAGSRIDIILDYLLCVSCTRQTRMCHLYLYQTDSATDVRNTSGAFSCVYYPSAPPLLGSVFSVIQFMIQQVHLFVMLLPPTCYS